MTCLTPEWHFNRFSNELFLAAGPNKQFFPQILLQAHVYTVKVLNYSTSPPPALSTLCPCGPFPAVGCKGQAWDKWAWEKMQQLYHFLHWM